MLEAGVNHDEDPAHSVGIPGIDYVDPDQQERIAIAAQALDRNAIVLSGPKATPLFVWSKQAYDGPTIKSRVEAGGNNPYTVLAGWPLPMNMLMQVPGRPEGYGYCWLVVVAIRARNV